jgi:hypothetical protein
MKARMDIMFRTSSVRLLVALAAFAILAASCVTAGLSTDPSATEFDKPPHTDPPVVFPTAQCIPDPTIVGQEVPRTIDNMAMMSEVIVVGEFKGIGKARWDTPDGSRPKDLIQEPAVIIRPVLIETETAVRGDPSRAALAFLRGGTIGCDRMLFAGEPVPTEGSRYVFWLLRSTDSRGGPVPDLGLLEAWPIDANEIVQTPLDGKLSLNDLASRVAKVPYSPPSVAS